VTLTRPAIPHGRLTPVRPGGTQGPNNLSRGAPGTLEPPVCAPRAEYSSPIRHKDATLRTLGAPKAMTTTFLCAPVPVGERRS